MKDFNKLCDLWPGLSWKTKLKIRFLVAKEKYQLDRHLFGVLVGIFVWQATYAIINIHDPIVVASLSILSGYYSMLIPRGYLF